MLRALPLPERKEAFFRYWTRREAYLKARGGGLSDTLAEADVSVARCEPMVVGNTEILPPKAAPWFVRELNPGRGYVVVIAIAGVPSLLTFGQWPSSMWPSPPMPLGRPDATRSGSILAAPFRCCRCDR